MIRRVVFAILVLTLAAGAGLAAGCGDGVSGDTVAKVGKAVIKEDQLEQRAEEFSLQYNVPDKETDPEGWKAFQSEVLEYLITYQLAVQKSEELGVSVTDEEVQTEIDSIITAYYDGDEAAFTEELTSAGMTLEKLKANYAESMLLQKVYEKVIENVTDVPAEEIAAYYETYKNDFFLEEARTARHILITPGGEETNDATTTTTAGASSTTTTEITDADWADALATAEEVRALLVAGGDWTELAAEYSDDPSSANNGGELGSKAKGTYLPEFEDVEFSLQVDEISEPVKSSYGYHIIQVTAITEARQQTLEEVTEKIKSALLNDKRTETWLKWIADTKVELGVTYREDMEPTTTTSVEGTTTTVPGGETTTTNSAGTTTSSAGQTITTAATTTTTTAAPTTTTAAATTTTAKP